ncbi:MAG: hypothetical protein ACXACG_03720 [Candidatus Thorarchaeota archaeon]|jgi:hypothetical protein
MNNLNLVPDNDKKTIDALLFPSEEDMKKPSVALAYYEEKVSVSPEASLKFRKMFIDYADSYTDEYISNFGPPEEAIPMEYEVGFLESSIFKETGQSVKIFRSVDNIDLDAIKEQDYTLQEDSM